LILVILAVAFAVGNTAPVSVGSGGRFDLKIDCDAPNSDLSNLLSEAYRDLARPDTYQHVSTFLTISIV
jgi:hypothetical protein